MITHHDFTERTLQDSVVATQNRTTSITNAENLTVRVDITELSKDASLRLVSTLVFPNGKSHLFSCVFSEVGKQEASVWMGETKSGDMSVVAQFEVIGDVTFNASIVSFEKGEAISNN